MAQRLGVDEEVALGAEELHAVELAVPVVELRHVLVERGNCLVESGRVLLLGVGAKVPVLAKDVDDAVLLKLLRVGGGELKVGADGRLDLSLGDREALRAADELGDVGALLRQRLTAAPRVAPSGVDIQG